MTQSIGEDWRCFFDFVSSYCGKPNYFKDVEGHNPFYRYSSLADDNKGKACTADDLCPEHTYLGGNVKDLEDYFKRICEKQDVKFIYIGDNYLSDSAVSNLRAHWKGITLIEELNFEDPKIRKDPHSEEEYKMDESTLMDYKRYWGSYFADFCRGDSDVIVRHSWVTFAEKETSFTISLMKDFENLF
mmetsp:Transcript_34513/g.39936  ORF Transcript_34513/g.39936 Transcript_34513/m.39936 type:complete len:187 (+) Transcript_34513:795-1355(+)